MTDTSRLQTQAIRFTAVGLSGVAINAAVLTLLYGRLHWPLLVGVVLAAEVAMLNNFAWNDLWTFGQRAPTLGRFAQFNLSSLGGLAIALGITAALVGSGVPYMLANLGGIAASAACNFTVSKRWIWRQTA